MEHLIERTARRLRRNTGLCRKSAASAPSGARRGSARTLGRPAVAIAMLLLGGCHDDFQPWLTFTIPARFETDGRTAPPKISGWWRRFGSVELDAFMDKAAADNLDIGVAVAQLEQSEAQAEITRALLFPTLNFSSNSSRSQSSGTQVPGVISTPRIGDNFSKLLNASYVVDVWGQNRDQLRAAVLNRDASAYQVEVVRLTARAAVVNDYLVYAADLERVAVAKENLANAERVLSVIKDRLAAGTAAELDVAQQETLVANQRAQIPPLRLSSELSRTALALVLGQPPEGFRPNIKNLRRLTVPRVVPGLPASLLVRRPDVRQSEAQLAADDANVDVARKAFLPTITLTGDAGYQSAQLSTLLKPQSVVWSIASGLTQPIFEGGKLRGQLALTQAQRQQILEQYRRSILQALTDVENALLSIRENLIRERAEQIAVEAAKRAFTLSEQRLREGTIDLTTLLTVQNSLFSAQDLLIQSRLARLQAVVSLFQALGGDWDDR